MISLTKIFDFELAHAIHGYPGSCSLIHGHSYELQVTVSDRLPHQEPIPGLGLIVDFKTIKALVKEHIIKPLDHGLLLSAAYTEAHPEFKSLPNLVVWDIEPTAENMLIVFRKMLERELPKGIYLTALKLFETKQSFAEWRYSPE